VKFQAFDKCCVLILIELEEGKAYNHFGYKIGLMVETLEWILVTREGLRETH